MKSREFIKEHTRNTVAVAFPDFKIKQGPNMKRRLLGYGKNGYTLTLANASAGVTRADIYSVDLKMPVWVDGEIVAYWGVNMDRKVAVFVMVEDE